MIKTFKPFKSPYAKDNVTKNPVAASSYKGEEDLRCYECDAKLFYKGEHERKRKTGVTHQVRAHFFHSSDSTCRGESVSHLLAKDIVSKYAKFDYYHSCGGCSKQFRVYINTNDIYTVKQEYHWRDPDNTLFIPDVAYLNEHGKMATVVEINHTHRIPDGKITALNKASIIWVEVEANDIIDKYDKKEEYVFVQKSSVMDARNRCHDCIEAKLRREKWLSELREKQALERTARELIAREEAVERERMRLLTMAENERKREALEKERVLELEKAHKEKVLKQEQQILLEKERKAKESEVNEKKRNEHYKREEDEREAKRKRIEPLSEARRTELEYQFTSERQRLEYEDRKKHLMSYQNMMVEGRKKQRELKDKIQ